MYQCFICGKQVPKGQPRLTIVQYRQANHPYRSRVGRKWQLVKSGKWKLDWYDDPGGNGIQIAGETPVCASCKAKSESGLLKSVK